MTEESPTIAAVDDATPYAGASARELIDELSGPVLRAIPALIVITTPDGEIAEISETYHEYTGLTLDEARDWRAHQVIHSDDFERAMDGWAGALSSGDPMQSEMRLRRRDGVYRWHLVQARPVYGPPNFIRCWVTVSVDIEDRKRADLHQKYLAEATARLVAPLDSEELLGEIARLAVPELADICAIGVFDARNDTVRIETAGATEQEAPFVQGIHLRLWRHDPRSIETIGDLIARGTPAFVPDFSPAFVRDCAPNASQREAALALGAGSVACLPLATPRRAIGIVTFAMTRSGRCYAARDFTLLKEVAARLSITMENVELYRELQATAERLQRANAAKDEFLGMVSHELKTPITSVIGNAKILTRRFDTIEKEERDAALRDIADSGDRLNRIIDDLLALARLDQGEPLGVERIVLRDIVQRIVDEFARRAPERPVQVRTEGSPAPILAAPAYIEHVVRNLLSNAGKYSPNYTPIDVEVVRDEQEVRVLVLDRGLGVSPEEREQIFEPFHRSESAQRFGGLGLGLAVCRRVVEAQSGRIWVLPREGGGSEFGFALPILTER